MSARSADARRPLVQRILAAVDPRLSPGLAAALREPGPARLPERGQPVVIAGHRAAGKSTLLPLVAELLGRTGIDLDYALEREHKRPLKRWVQEAPQEFRAAERALFLRLPKGGVISVGGGFLSHHGEVLERCFTLLVPISLETYRERLLRDTSRPRLRPGVSREEEIAQLFAEREAAHARVPTVPLVDFLRAFPGAEVNR